MGSFLGAAFTEKKCRMYKLRAHWLASTNLNLIRSTYSYKVWPYEPVAFLLYLIYDDAIAH